MRRLYIRLDLSDFDALVRLARDERRHPSDQAAILIKNTLGTGGQDSKRLTTASQCQLVAAGE